MDNTDLIDFQVLGCSGGIGGSRRTTSFLLDEDVLIDCGTGVGDLPLSALRKIRHVFITHAHLDHVCMLPLLVDSVFDNLEGQPITLHASQKVLDILYDHLFNWQIWPDFFSLPSPDNPVMLSRPMEAGERIELDGRQITALAVEHTVAAQGYVVTNPNGKTLAFSGDTGSGERFWASLNDLPRLDHLLVECAYPEEENDLAAAAMHYTPSLLASDLRSLKHRAELSICHLKPGVEDNIMQQLSGLLPEYKIQALQSGQHFSL